MMLFVIKIYLVCWFITSFEPLIKALDVLLLAIPKRYITDILFDVLGCFKCLTFWITLILTLNPFTAIAASMIAQIHKKITK